MNESYKMARTLIHNYGFKSVFFKTWVKMALLLLPFNALCIAAFFIFQSNIANEITANNLNDFEHTSMALNTILEEVEKNYTILASNTHVNSFITSQDIHSEGLRLSQTTDAIYELMHNYINTSGYVDSIYLYNDTNNFVLSSLNSNYLENFSDKHWLPAFESGDVYTMLPYNGDQLSICYRLGVSSRHSGMLVFNLNRNDILDIISSSTDMSDKQLALFDSNKNMIFSFCGTLSDDEMLNVSDFSHSYKDGIYESFHKNTSKYHVFSNKYNIYLYEAVSLNTDTLFPPAFRILFVLGILFIILFSCILAFFMALQSYMSIARISGLFYDMVTSGQIRENNEILDITTNIMNMNKNYNTLKDELVKNLAALRDSQSLALQNQINSHFLFNTLNMVNLMIMEITHKDCAPITVISLLSDLLNESLCSNEYIISVKSELSLVEKYILIEKMKYNNSFDVKWNIDETVLNSSAVKFSLQPIVENAFIHGFRSTSMKNNWLLKISVQKKNGNIEYRISNNGKTISDEKLSELRRRLLEQDIISTKHIGLCNVNNRIKLIFGEGYGISIKSHENETCVIVTTPDTPFT